MTAGGQTAMAASPAATAEAGRHATASATDAGQRRRVLIISPWHPEPVDNGSKQRLAAMIAALRGWYDIGLVTLAERAELADGPLPPVGGVWRQWAWEMPGYAPRSPAAILAATSRYPRSFVTTWDARVAAAIGQIVHEHGFDLAIGADVRVLRYLLDLADALPVLLGEANVSPFTADALRPAHLGERLRAALREAKYRRLLRLAAARLDAVIVPTREEARAYRRLAGTARVHVVPNGVAAFPATLWRAPATRELLYTGSPTYAPNAEAAEHFLRAVLPLVQREFPDARLVVTGALPERLPDGLVHPHLRLTGRLDTLDAAYRAARLFVAPILSGTGSRVKLLEAMAQGMPIVSTTKGAEGIGATPGKHLLIADDPPAFAAAVCGLLADPARSEDLGAAGAAFVRDHYDWASIGVVLRGIVAGALERHANVF